ncbi:MAG: tRNA pseudouridine(55) synthase TruB [Lentisphaeria bacterium]|nr:tRNA pseudouridine(55) synthase TruB [Lentisphaeria bacterium]
MPICDVSGMLLIDKPSGWTSFDVVNFVRSRFNVPKVGHCGTLDPAATGLLVLMLGAFTRISDLFSADDKSYEGTMELGRVTDSGDLDGKVVREADCSGVTEQAVLETFRKFTGEQMQIPPMVSAVKVGGKKLYELARKGVEIEREPRKIVIARFELLKFASPYCDFAVDCSKGTYIRTLCADVGEALGCGGVLTRLRRTRSGRFSVSDALPLEALKELDQDAFRDLVISKLMALAGPAR